MRRPKTSVPLDIKASSSLIFQPAFMPFLLPGMPGVGAKIQTRLSARPCTYTHTYTFTLIRTAGTIHAKLPQSGWPCPLCTLNWELNPEMQKAVSQASVTYPEPHSEHFISFLSIRVFSSFFLLYCFGKASYRYRTE
jgi:hypothetical protein